MEYILEQVKCSPLQVDYDYQRPLDKNRVNKIATHWKDEQARPLILSLRTNNQFYVVDGNHTRTAAIIKFGPEVQLPAKIYVDLSKEQEAELFYALNSNSKAPTFNDKLRARYVAQEPEVIAYIDALNESGCYWRFNGGGKSGPFTGHSTGIKMFKKYGKDIFVDAMNAMEESNDRQMLNINILVGICKVLADTPLTKKDIITVLRKASFDELVKATKVYGNIRRDGTGSDDILFAMAILDIYNKGKAKKNRIQLSSIEQ